MGVTSPPFTPTVWPAETPGHVRRHKLHRDRGVLRIGARLEDVALPSDFALQEWLGFDASDLDALVEFSERWGLISPPGAEATRWFGNVPMPLARSLKEYGNVDNVVFPHVVAGIVKTGQAMSRHFIARREGVSLADVTKIWTPTGQPPPRDLHTADVYWRDFMNGGLGPYTVHVRLDHDDDALWTRPVPLLYNAVCLELAQYAAGDVRVFICGNDRCEKHFTRKRRKAANHYRQHRSRSLVFCSDLCERAQSERDRRRRRAEEREAVNG